MNSGHPPASGIIALLVVLAITPLSGLCLLVALFGRFRYEGHRQTHYDLALGINLLYVITLAQIWFYKAVLEKAI